MEITSNNYDCTYIYISYLRVYIHDTYIDLIQPPIFIANIEQCQNVV